MGGERPVSICLCLGLRCGCPSSSTRLAGGTESVGEWRQPVGSNQRTHLERTGDAQGHSKNKYLKGPSHCLQNDFDGTWICSLTQEKWAVVRRRQIWMQCKICACYCDSHSY